MTFFVQCNAAMNTNETIDMDFDVNKICRLCTGKRNALLPIFDSNEDLPAKIKILSPCIQVSSELTIT